MRQHRTSWPAISILTLLTLALTAGPSPGGNFFISTEQGSVLEYTPTGQFVTTFVAAGSGGLGHAPKLAFRPRRQSVRSRRR